MDNDQTGDEASKQYCADVAEAYDERARRLENLNSWYAKTVAKLAPGQTWENGMPMTPQNLHSGYRHMQEEVNRKCNEALDQARARFVDTAGPGVALPVVPNEVLPKEPPTFPPSPPLPPTSANPEASRRKKVPTAVRVLVAVGAVAAVAIGWNTLAQAQSTFTAKGTIKVTGGFTGDQECHGTGGYDDMGGGGQVKITVDGKTVGVGSLGNGVADGLGRWCQFSFSVPDVPSGSKFYSVEVTHRGALDFNEDQLRSGVSLQLGS